MARNPRRCQPIALAIGDGAATSSLYRCHARFGPRRSPPRPAPASRFPHLKPLISSSSQAGRGAVRLLLGGAASNSGVTEAVTGKPLIIHGLRVCYWCYRDIRVLYMCGRAGVRAHTHLHSFSNISNRYKYLSITEGWLLLRPLLASITCGNSGNRAASAVRVVGSSAAQRNIIGGGYRFAAPAVVASADLQLIWVGARRNFRGRNAGGGLGLGDRGGIAAGSVEVDAVAKNGGFLRVSGCRSGHVGTTMSECASQGIGLASFSPAAQQLSRLRTVALGGAVAAIVTEGCRPPFGPRLVSSMLTLPIFGHSGALEHGRLSGSMDGSPTCTRKMGLGVELFSACFAAMPCEARNPSVTRRVGDEGHPVAVRRKSQGTATLWGGYAHVNA